MRLIISSRYYTTYSTEKKSEELYEVNISTRCYTAFSKEKKSKESVYIWGYILVIHVNVSTI